MRAGAAYGLPRQLLSDNHSSFTGRLLGVTVEFERKLAQLGVQPINAAPAHPQTLGKLERFHRTLKEWLQDQRPARDLKHLQLLLERFRRHYNGDRPHQGIDNQAPAERYLRERSRPLEDAALVEREREPAYPPYSVTRRMWANGVTNYRGMGIILGKRFAGARVRIVEVGPLVHIYLGEELLRAVVPDHTRRFRSSRPPAKEVLAP